MTCRQREEPRVLSQTTGRLRLHLPEPAVAELRKLPGVREVKANPLTGNVLVRFDPETTTAERVLAAVTTGTEARSASQGIPSLTLRASTAELAGCKPAATRGQALLRAGLRGLVGHALFDTAWYAVAFAEPFGLPLAGLGALHLGLDLFIWTAALAPVLGGKGAAPELPAPARTAS